MINTQKKILLLCFFAWVYCTFELKDRHFPPCSFNDHRVLNWLSIGCVAPYGGEIYNLRNEIFVFNDPKALEEDSEPNTLDEVPIRLRRPGTCAGYTIEGSRGEMGIMPWILDYAGNKGKVCSLGSWVKNPFPIV